jgi:hypothetical protein
MGGRPLIGRTCRLATKGDSVLSMIAAGPDSADSTCTRAFRGDRSGDFSRRLALRYLLVLTTCLAGLPGCRPTLERPSESPTATAPVPDNPPGDALCAAVDDVLDFTYRERELSVETNAAWQILHGVLAYQREFLIKHDGVTSSAVDYLLDGGSMRGWTVEIVTDPRSGRRGLRAALELGSQAGQGHTDQWLANMVQAGLSLDQGVKVDGETVTMQEWLGQSQWDVPRNLDREYSWTLIAMNRCLPTDATWAASDGQTWSIERLVQEEASQDLNGSACGGTHRAIALAAARRHRRTEGRSIDGGWLEAEDVVQEAMALAQEYQNPDGSFSTRFFERPGTSPDLAINLGSTGHTLEFLSIAVSDEQLREPWMQRAVLYLCDVFRATRKIPLECGALYHAAHGLVLYRQRVFGPRSYAVPAPAPNAS